MERSASPVVHVGWDTEYRTLWSPGGEKALGNLIVSVQFWCAEAGEGLLVLPAGKPTMEDLLRVVLGWLEDVVSGPCRRPRTLRLAAHCLKAEIFSTQGWKRELPRLLPGVQSVGGSLVSSKADAVRLRDASHHTREVAVELRDTLLLSGGMPLSVIGEQAGLAKVRIPPAAGGEAPWIERMDDFLRTLPEVFVEYAMTDAVISVHYLMDCLGFLRRSAGANAETGCGDHPGPSAGIIPSTASALACRVVMDRIGDGLDRVAPRRRVKCSKRTSAGAIRTTCRVEIPEAIWEAARAFHGGRNETYRFGVEPGVDVWDYDLAGAYSTAMLTVQDADWDNPQRLTSLPGDLAWNDLGYAVVRFAFREDCRFPSFPVVPKNARTNDWERSLGLCFPLEGTARVTLTELWTALRSGQLAEVKVMDGLRFRRLKGFTLAGAVRGLLLEREACRRDEGRKGEEAYWKLVCNSVYGKIAQGLGGKTGLDLPRTLALLDGPSGADVAGERIRQRIPASPLTNPVLASYITGVIRASMGEYLTALDREGRAGDVVNCTTDGFMLAGPPLDESWTRGERPSLVLNRLLSQVRALWLGEGAGPLLVLKHQTGAGFWAVRTRCYGMLPDSSAAGSPKRLLLARGGMSTRGMDVEAAVRHVTGMFLSGDRRYSVKTLSGIEDCLRRGMDDLLPVEWDRKMNWDYDIKRCPVDPVDRTVEWEGQRFVKASYKTRPWKRSEDFSRARELYAQRAGKSVKSAGELQKASDVEDFLLALEIDSAGGRYARTPQDVLWNKVIWFLRREGWDNTRIASVAGVTREKVKDRCRGKSFLAYTEGRFPLWPLTPGLKRLLAAEIRVLVARLRTEAAKQAGGTGLVERFLAEILEGKARPRAGAPEPHMSEDYMDAAREYMAA